MKRMVETGFKLCTLWCSLRDTIIRWNYLLLLDPVCFKTGSHEAHDFSQVVHETYPLFQPKSSLLSSQRLGTIFFFKEES